MGEPTTDPDPLVRPTRRRRIIRRLVIGAIALNTGLVLLIAAGWVALLVENSGTPSPAAHGTGHDAEWLGRSPS